MAAIFNLSLGGYARSPDMGIIPVRAPPTLLRFMKSRRLICDGEVGVSFMDSLSTVPLFSCQQPSSGVIESEPSFSRSH